MIDVEDWLGGLGLERYVEAFAGNDVDDETLVHLTGEDLKEIGVASVGHRRKLLAAIALLRQDSSRPDAATAGGEVPAAPDTYTPPHLAEQILRSRSAIEGERKQVTVLFADIKGSLELIESADPEDAQVIFDRAIRTMMKAVHRYAGTVNKVLGDGIMALFGAPLAFEDHAVRACYAALDMQQAIRHSAADVRRDLGVEVEIRVGINSGEVVVRSIGNDLSMNYDAIGQTVHLAGRMEQLALPGTIRFTRDTRRLAEGFVDVTPLGLVPIKGLDEPVEVFELTGVTATRTRFRTAIKRGLSQFVGRQAEIEAFGRALAWTSEGHGQIVAVIGEPGVGKSRLFYEFVHSHHTESSLVLEGGSVSYGMASAYLSIVDLLKNYFQVEVRDDTRRIQEKVTGKLLTLDESLRPLLPAFLSLLDVLEENDTWDALDPPQRRRMTLDALKALIVRESQVQNLVLMFEDLQWIDSETQAFLDSLVESLPTSRILLLVNYRPEYRHEWSSKSYYTQRRIDPLPTQTAEELVAGLLGEDSGLERLRKLLIDRTGGNPFFIEECVRTLVETDALHGTRGDYHLSTALEHVDMPATVQGVLAARIDRLPMEEKLVLQTSSVIGKDFPHALLQAVEDIPEDELQQRLAALRAAEFIYETRLFPNIEYTFKHALTHEVAYGSLLQERRQRLHRRIAETIEAVYADRQTEQLERLAHHYTEARMTEHAIPYWHKAGRRAMERSAHPEAIAHLSKGLKLLGAMPYTSQNARQELASQLAIGPALMSAKGWGDPEVERVYRRARQLALAVGESTELFAALWGLWLFNHLSANMDLAKRLTAEILDLAKGEADPGLLLQAHHAAWTTDFHSGDFLGCWDHAEKGTELYQSEEHYAQSFVYGGHDPGVCSRDTAGGALWLLGYPEKALALGREAVGLAQAISHPMSQVIALNGVAMLHQFRRETRLSRDNAEATIELCVDQEIAPTYQANAIVLQGWCLADAGSIDEGIERMHQGLSLMRAAQAERGRMYYLALLAEMYGRNGECEKGLVTLEDAIEQIETTGERWWEAEILRLKGQLLLGCPDSENEAEACFSRALDVARLQKARSLELRAATSLARVWMYRGKVPEAEELLSPICEWFSEGLKMLDLTEAAELLHGRK